MLRFWRQGRRISRNNWEVEKGIGDFVEQIFVGRGRGEDCVLCIRWHDIAWLVMGGR